MKTDTSCNAILRDGDGNLRNMVESPHNTTDTANGHIALYDPQVIRVARTYVRRIRNENKRAFAENYLGSILRNETRPPRPTLQALSYMAAQSVEIHLCDLFNV